MSHHGYVKSFTSIVSERVEERGSVLMAPCVTMRRRGAARGDRRQDGDSSQHAWREDLRQVSSRRHLFRLRKPGRLLETGCLARGTLDLPESMMHYSSQVSDLD